MKTIVLLLTLLAPTVRAEDDPPATTPPPAATAPMPAPLPAPTAAVTTAATAPAPAAAGEALAELDELLSRQRSEHGACNKFRKKWHSVVKGGLTRDSASHVSASQASDALKLLEKYPFRGGAQARVWAYFVEHQDELARHPEQKAVLERYSSMEPQCEMFSRSVHRELLLKDVAAFSLGKKEKRGIARIARAYLKDEGADATLSGLGLKAGFLSLYLEKLYDGANRDALKLKSAALLRDLDEGRARADAERKQLRDAGKSESITYYAPEFRLWGDVRAKLAAIVAELED